MEEAVGAASTEIWGRCAVGFVKEQAMLLRERLHLGGPAGSRFMNARGDGEPDDEVAARGFDRGPWQVISLKRGAGKGTVASRARGAR